MQNTASNLQEQRDTKKPGRKLRKYEKSWLQYDLVQTEEPGYRIEKILRSLLAPLSRGRQIILWIILLLLIFSVLAMKMLLLMDAHRSWILVNLKISEILQMCRWNLLYSLSLSFLWLKDKSNVSWKLICNLFSTISFRTASR